MKLADCLQPDMVFTHVMVKSKKKAFEIIGEKFASKITKLSVASIFEVLVARERLGSTGLGYGVAIPHARMAKIVEPICLVMTLAQPIDYDAPDNLPVDILLALLVPINSEQEHLDLLADIASLFSQRQICDNVRHAKDDATLYKTLVNLHA